MRLDADVLDAAHDLIGAVVTAHGVRARITEVEAYAGPADPASHAFTRTPRSAIMFGPPGRLYVYRIHGHCCANIVTGVDGVASAVLLRSARIIDGLDVARSRRGAVDEAALARGPGNLARALGITMSDLGTDVLGGDAIDVRAAGKRGDRMASGPRVGVRRAADRPWRFWVADDPTVSAYRRHPRAQVEPQPG